MNQLEGLLILLALPAGLLLTGYWLSALLRDVAPLERLTLALPAGLVTALTAVASVNFFQPLAGVWAYACLSTALIPVLVPAVRRSLVRDIVTVWGERQKSVLAASALFFVCLLWPVLHNPASLFHDGTSNHDSFFWISGAEHLKRNTYMDQPVLSATQPLTNSTPAIIGWKPPWGRMGAEGLLAMASSVVGLSPLKLFLYATASLQFTWIALAWLALRTFYGPLTARPLAAALVCLQPVFVFFFGNSNLPNLLGALAGATLIIATQRALNAGSGRERTAWLGLIALGLHALLCAYPEMVPFVLLPAGLLWLRHGFTTGLRAATPPCLLVAGAIIAGLLLNPASTIRAYHGFMASFAAARADTNWANLFNPLVLGEYVPALATLSVSAARDLDHWLGWPVTLALIVSVGCMFRHARDRFGLAAVFASTLLLLGYTIVTDFAYGWQKSVQFAGVFFGMAFPAAALDALNRERLADGPALWRRLCTVGLAGLAVFLTYATIMEFRQGYKWSDRKVISADWFILRQQAAENLRGRTVLVEPASFRMAFFHGMWAAYFLRDSHIYYAARGEENGGYLRDRIHTELHPDMPAPAAYLVGRIWADTFDANSPRILTGREFTLLQKSNRVFTMAGVTPLNGLPDYASGAVQFEILPHSSSNLLVELEPREIELVTAAEWHLGRSAEGSVGFTETVSGPPPWRLKIPLVASQRNRITITLAGAEEPPGVFRFIVRSLRIEDGP